MAHRALAELRRFLDARGASIEGIDVAALDAIERGFMTSARGHVAARLIGVPVGLEGEWLAYARVYCRYLAASDRMRAPCTVFVAVGGEPMLRVCLLRASNGRTYLRH